MFFHPIKEELMIFSIHCFLFFLNKELSWPTSSFEPIVIVSGRSVEFLRVTHGTFSTVASSVIPPESVITAFQFLPEK